MGAFQAVRNHGGGDPGAERTDQRYDLYRPDAADSGKMMFDMVKKYGI